MKDVKAFRILIAVVVFAGCLECTSKPIPGNHRPGAPDSVRIDHVFTNQFIRNCCGFTGGDGTYSVLLPDGRTVWIFGDTFLGTVNPDRSRPRLSPMFIRNSAVVQEGDSLRTLYHGTPENYASWIIPAPKMGIHGLLPEDSLWFWPGDGFIEGGKLRVFLSEFIQADTGMWGFEWRGTWLASFSLPGIEQESLIQIPHGLKNGVHYGHCICTDDQYIYVYGAKLGKVHAARYKKERMAEGWEFYTGKTWSTSPELSMPLSNFIGSEQFSIFKYQNKFLMVNQLSGMFGNTIYGFVADTPVGPWSKGNLLYTTPEMGKNLFTYNAVAHPQFTSNGEILISYNVNSFILGDHFINADIYRPRFIRVPVSLFDPAIH
jgi:hypothetical protein